MRIAAEVRIQVPSLRILKQNIFVRNENMTKKKFLSNIVLLKNLSLIFEVTLKAFIILKIFHESAYQLNFWEYKWFQKTIPIARRVANMSSILLTPK